MRVKSFKSHSGRCSSREMGEIKIMLAEIERRQALDLEFLDGVDKARRREKRDMEMIKEIDRRIGGK